MAGLVYQVMRYQDLPNYQDVGQLVYNEVDSLSKRLGTHPAFAVNDGTETAENIETLLISRVMLKKRASLGTWQALFWEIWHSRAFRRAAMEWIEYILFGEEKEE